MKNYVDTYEHQFLHQIIAQCTGLAAKMWINSQ
jgi:hypothetical protein